jgi:hypothetical protein
LFNECHPVKHFGTGNDPQLGSKRAQIFQKGIAAHPQAFGQSLQIGLKGHIIDQKIVHPELPEPTSGEISQSSVFFFELIISFIKCTG